jgi:hypothetical protein
MTRKSIHYCTLAGFATAILSAGSVGAYDFAPPAPGLPADAINTFNLWVGDEETYDTNLFRVPPGTVGVPDAAFAHASQSDTVTTPAVGGEGKWDVDRQQFDAKFVVDDTRFAHNDALNYVGADGAATWNWLAGPYLSGQVGVVYDRTLAGFGQTRFSGFDLVTSLQEFASGRYQVGPHWAVYGGVGGSYSDHSVEQLQYNDFHNKSGTVGVQYANNASDTYAFEYKYVDVTFKQDANLASQGYNYNEDTAKFLAHYELTDKTWIEGYGGYIRRDYPGVSVGAYSGGMGRAAVTYNWTDKTQIIVTGWRELHAYIDAESNYFVAQGGSIGPTWNATEKLSFVLLASFENQDYINSSTAILGAPRHDKVDGEQVTVRYSPRDALSFNVFYRHEKRESNEYEFSYDDNLVSAGVTFRFL